MYTRRFIRSHGWLLTGWLLSMGVSTAATLALPMLLRKILVDDRAAHGLAPWLIGMLAVSVVLAASTSFRYLFVAWLGDSAATELRVGMFARLLQLDTSFFLTANTADLCARIGSDVEVVEALLCGGVSIAVRSALAALGAWVAMILTNPMLSAISTLIIPLSLLIIGVLGPRIRRQASEVQKLRSRSSAVVSETLGNNQLVKAYGIESLQFRKFVTLTTSASDVSRARVSIRAAMTFAIILIAFGIFVATLWVGTGMVASGATSQGKLAQFVIYAVVLASSVLGLAEVWGDLMQARGASDRAAWVFEQPRPDPKPQSTASDLGDLHAGPAVAFDNVSFRHEGAPVDTVHRVSFSIGRGELVAIVGPSGAGKSTLLNLMLRLFEPGSGTIVVGGRVADDMGIDQLRRRFAFVPQDSSTLAASVAENIHFGHGAIDMSHVIAAAVAADAHDFIMALDQGYETQLGEGGAGLSGGQRQRIALARAIYRDAEILLMDEATASLDGRSESVVQRAIAARRGHRATVIIAHRLSTVISADRIIVLDRGMIVAQGTHKDLMASSSLYSALARSQFIAQEFAA